MIWVLLSMLVSVASLLCSCLPAMGTVRWKLEPEDWEPVPRQGGSDLPAKGDQGAYFVTIHHEIHCPALS